MNLLLSWPALSVCTLQEPIWRRGLRRRTLTVCSYCVAVAQGQGGARTTRGGRLMTTRVCGVLTVTELAVIMEYGIPYQYARPSQHQAKSKQAFLPGARGASEGACRSGL